MAARSKTIRMVAALVAAVAISGCGACDRSPATPEPRARVVSIVQDDAELLHRSTARTAADLDELRDIGVDWIRVTAGWSAIAPVPTADRPPRRFDGADPAAYPRHAWTALDRLHRMAARRGLRLAIDIAFWAPRWAVARPNADRTAGNERNGVNPRLFADFAEAVARRYPDSAAFTIWNEPNHTAFLLPQWERDARGRWAPAAPRIYRDMLRAAVPLVKAAAPRALVLIGATSSLGAARASSARERMSPLTFARALACVDAQDRPDPALPGCAGAFVPLPGDGWSHHPYSVDRPPSAHDPRPETVRMGDLGRLTTLLHDLHATGRTAVDLPLYLTEFGYQTNPPDPTQRAGLRDQSNWLAEAEELAYRRSEVRSTAQFLLRDLPVRRGPDLRTRWRDYQSGLRFSDGRPKPALAAFALPLVVRQPRVGRLSLWALVRPGSGSQPITVERRAPGDSRWQELGTWTTAPDGELETVVDGESHERFRVVSGGRTGAEVRVTR